MKKFSMMLIALALFVPAMASAQINWYGQLDVLGYSIDKDTFAQEGTSNTYSRVILGANFGLSENIEGNATLSYFNTWGDTYLAGQQINNNDETGLLSSTRLIEANVVFKNLFENDRFSVKVGRQFYDGGTLFNIGPRDLIYYYLFMAMAAPYPNYLTEGGMDGAVLTYCNKEDLKIDVGYSKLVSENTPIEQKINISFVNAKYKYNDMWKIQGYLYDSEIADIDLSDPNNSVYKSRVQYLGIKPEVTLGAFNMAVEGIQCLYNTNGSIFSTEDTKDGYFLKMDATYDINALKVRGMYFMTGSQFYIPYTQNLYLGYVFTSSFRSIFSSGYVAQMFSMDVLNFGADYTLNKFKFTFDYFRLGRERHAGNKSYEVDLGVQYNYTENVCFKGGVAYCGDEENGEYDPGALYLLGLSYKFGSK